MRYFEGSYFNWSLIMYDDYDSILNDIVLAQKTLVHFAISPYHDKDTKDDGDGFKEPHYHVLLIFKKKYSLEEIQTKIFDGCKQNIFGEKIIDKCSAFKYLSHDGFTDKVLYDSSDIYCDNLEYWTTAKNEDDSLCILEDLKNGVSLESLVSVYGRKIIYHIHDYLFYLKLMSYEDRGGKLIDYREY